MTVINEQINSHIEAIREVAGYLWEKGWAERNGGNISVDLTGLIKETEFIKGGRYVIANLPVGSAKMILFVTGTGERLRDLRTKAEKVSCILMVDSEAKGYNLVWGGEENLQFRPTSELISHISIHLYNRSVDNGHRCVVHTHPIELIALSHHPEFGKDENKLNKALWSMLPEIRVFVPKGIAIAEYLLPGSKELAELTVKRLETSNVILWSKHGALSSGKDALEAFDYIDVANKGAIIYLKCLQAGFVPVGLTDDELKGLEIYI